MGFFNDRNWLRPLLGMENDWLRLWEKAGDRQVLLEGLATLGKRAADKGNVPLMKQTAYALAVLNWKGAKVPALAELDGYLPYRRFQVYCNFHPNGFKVARGDYAAWRATLKAVEADSSWAWLYSGTDRKLTSFLDKKLE